MGWIRVIVRLIVMVCALVACVPLYYLWAPFTEHNPWPRRFLSVVCTLAGVRIDVTGSRAGKGTFLLSNHVSWIDIPAIASVTGTAFVANDGLESVPFIRWLCAMNDTVFIARHDRRSIAAQVAQVREAIRETGALTVFPEGTTSDGTGLLPFKSSLLSALDPPPPGVEIQPVYLSYGSETATIAWIGEEPGLHNFLRILARRKNVQLEMHFLQPLAGPSLLHRKEMAATAHVSISTAMQLKSTSV